MTLLAFLWVPTLVAWPATLGAAPQQPAGDPPVSLERIRGELDKAPPRQFKTDLPMPLPPPTFRSRVDQRVFVPTLEEHLRKEFALTLLQRQSAEWASKGSGLDIGLIFRAVERALDERRVRKTREQIARELTELETATFVTRFYTAYIKEHTSGLFLQGGAERALLPLLSKRLRQRMDDAVACQAEWVRQQPKGSTDKPPFVDCCLFSGSADGMPTSFSPGPTRVLPDGRYQTSIDFVRRESADVVTWRDAVILVREGGRLVVDDLVYDVDTASRDDGRLSDALRECQGRKGIAGR
jgi:hypothetical protein